MRKVILLINLFFGILFIACESTEEGCLDILSSNFSVHAVNACDSCCTYPLVRNNFKFVYDTIEFGFNDTILLNEMDTFVLVNFKSCFNNYTFKSIDSSYTILDSVEVNDAFIKDDFVFIDSETNYTIGSVRFEDKIESIEFQIGLDDNTATGFRPFDNINQESNLDESLDSLYNINDSTFSDISITIQLGDELRTIIINELASRNVSINNENDVLRGNGIDFQTVIDIKALLAPLSISSTDQDILNNINNNIQAAISIE